MFVVEILEDERLSSFYINYSPLAIMSIGIASSILVLGITIYYFVPRKSSMPLMGCSAKLVFESCKGLSWPLPRNGIAWGDISTLREHRAGFAEHVSLLKVGTIYPSTIYASGNKTWSIGSQYLPDYSDTAYLLANRRE
jgi:hypothetical protein